MILATEPDFGVANDDRFSNFAGRMEHRIELEEFMTRWCAQCTGDDAMRLSSEVEAVADPVFDMADIAHDPHYIARNMIPLVGGTPMQGLIADFSETPGELRWEGRPLDADGDVTRLNGWEASS